MKRFLERLLQVLLITVIVLLAFFVVSGVLQRVNKRHPYTGLFGVGYAVVVSGSMEPNLHVNDLIFYTANRNKPYEIGDVIVFIREDGQEEMLITHRIIAVSETGVTTKGDANPVQDPNETVFSDIVGKIRVRIPYLGVLTSFLRTPLGLTLVVLAAGLVILLRLMSKRHREEEGEDLDGSGEKKE